MNPREDLYAERSEGRNEGGGRETLQGIDGAGEEAGVQKERTGDLRPRYRYGELKAKLEPVHGSG